MRSAQLRDLSAFFATVEEYGATLSRDTSECRCSLSPAGRWEPPSAGCVGERGCRQVLHLVVRAHLARLRMPVDHLTDPELDDAVDQLRRLCLQAPGWTADAFAAGVQRALRSERVTAAGDQQ